MRVARLELTGVGPFEGAVFEIPEPPAGTRGELTFFEGPNGCGKTTVTQAIACALDPNFTFGQPESGLHTPRSELNARVHRPLNPNVAVTIEEAGEHLTAYGAAVADGKNTQAARTLQNYQRGGHLSWAAFAYQGHQQTPVIATRGPSQIVEPPLRGALSFGAFEPASALFGQLLVNLDQEVAKAFHEAHREGISPERRQELDQLNASRQKMLDDIARALSAVLGRQVHFDVPVGQHAPKVFVDGEAIPLPLLGEGMRSTFAWLSDLLVRLHRITWAHPTCSPLEQDFWLILDEIDESLHPNLQTYIYPALRQLFPNARIYATTHSPFVIASVGEGVVFPIRPGKDHKVRGEVEAHTLEPGQTLEYVTTEIFQARDGFVDQKTRDMLDEHRRDIRRFRKTKTMDWDAFFARRAKLFELNDEVRTAVAMQEVPVRREVDEQMLARGEAREQRELGTGA